jgi:hypothetical protein
MLLLTAVVFELSSIDVTLTLAPDSIHPLLKSIGSDHAVPDPMAAKSAITLPLADTLNFV